MVRPRLAQPTETSTVCIDLGEFLQQSRSPRLFAVTAAAIVALACFRVASVPSTAPTTASTWSSVVTEVLDDIETSLVGFRAEVMQQRATYTQMWNDIENLEETLTSGNTPTIG